LPEIAHGQAHELVAPGFELHPPQQLARASLVLGAGMRQRTDLFYAAGKCVSLTLELGEAEQARAAEALAAGVTGGVGGNVREAAGDDLRQLALQSRDLRAQRTSRRQLVDEPDGRCAAVDRQLLGLAHASDSSSCGRTRRFYQRRPPPCDS
jgi:hypothetical protein